MDRKNFIKDCIAIGVALPFSNTHVAKSLISSQTAKTKLPFDGIMAIDAHSQPYLIHSRHYSFWRIFKPNSASTVERMKDAGFVASVFAAMGDRWVSEDPSKSSFEDTLEQLKHIKGFEERKKVRLLKNKSDLDFSSNKNESFGAIMAIEGGDALQGNIQNINKFHNYGVRLITLLHKNDNEIGFNQESYNDGPLSPFGTRVVEKMIEMGMIIDVAHSNSKTLKSISEVCKLPLLDSHTGIFPEGEVNNFPNRARTWEEMEMIAKSGGLVCTMPVSGTVGNYAKTTLTSWVKEIVLMKERLGIEHVGLGTDSSGLPQLVDGWDSVASLPNLVNELLKFGLSKNDIIAFTGGNFLRIMKNYFL
jgi:membrane dipeptidase